MTTSALSTPARPTGPTGIDHRQTLGRVIRSEWIKLRTLRSTWIGFGSAFALLVGVAVIASLVTNSNPNDPNALGPLETVLAGGDFAVLLIGVLGVVAGAREYGSRMISATIAAVPRRWQVVAGKAVVFGGLVAATALAGVLIAFAVGMSILSAGDGATVGLGDDGALRSVLGMAGYITALGVIGLGLGVLLRSVAGAIGALLGGVMFLPAIAAALLPSGVDPVLQFLPVSAAAAFTTVAPAGDSLLPAGAGALVLAAWVALAVGGSIVAITRRDV